MTLLMNCALYTYFIFCSQITVTAVEEVKHGGPETEESAYAVLEQDISDPVQVLDNSGHSTT